jgi:diaminopimelate epimerase
MMCRMTSPEEQLLLEFYVNYIRRTQMSMLIPYTKMQGAGNEILVVDQRDSDHPPPSPEEIRRLGQSGKGPSFDQLMWVGPPRNAKYAASYRVFNRDGSEVEQCGNGVRCVARVLAGAGGCGGGEALLLEGPAGEVEVTVLDDGRVAASMGIPEFDPAKIPFVADDPQEQYELDVGGQKRTVSVLSIGNPHCVLLVDSIPSADVDRLGPAIEEHPRFPEGANVGFMCVTDPTTIELRVWERGVGETLACGTGACAAVIAGIQLGLVAEDVSVRLPGGELMVSWHGGKEPVWLTGNAELISEGTIDL